MIEPSSSRMLKVMSWLEQSSWKIHFLLFLVLSMAVGYTAYSLRGAAREEAIGTIGWSSDFLYLPTESFRLLATVKGAVEGDAKDLSALEMRHELLQARIRLIVTGSMPSKYANDPELHEALADVEAGGVKIDRAFSKWKASQRSAPLELKAAVEEFAPVSINFYNVSRELFSKATTEDLTERKDLFLIICGLILVALLIASLSSIIMQRHIQNQRAAKQRLADSEAELANLTERLKVQLKAAQSANFAKSRFLATMSHELRTPLNAVIGFSQMLQSEIFGPLGSARYKEYVGDILMSGQHLLSLINDILDLSRIESRRQELRFVAVDVSDEIKATLDATRLQAATKSIELEVQNHAPDVRLWCDSRSLRQILMNLVSNAVKFTDPRGRIAIVIDPVTEGQGVVPEHLKISVEDTGIGIPKDVIPKLGMPFVQGDDAYDRCAGGTGLGLTISKSLTEAMGGSMSIESEVGVGTIVSIILPTVHAERLADTTVIMPDRAGVQWDREEDGGAKPSNANAASTVETNSAPALM